MKSTIVIAFLFQVAVRVYAQGSIALDNNSNNSTSPAATANGLFWVSTGGTPFLINQDFNAAFYGGANSNSLAPIAVFLLSNGTATHDNPFPGLFSDPTAQAYAIPDTSQSAFFQIQAWTGNLDSYAAAVSGGAFAAQSPVFGNPVSGAASK